MEISKANTACFSGHRSIPEALRQKMIYTVDAELHRCISRNITCFIAGGAVGFDMLCAARVAALKRDSPELCVSLILALPCRNQTEKWSELSDLRMYQYLLGCADHIEYTGEMYTSGCYHKRNRWMVDNSSLCIAYLTKNSGGTAYTVGYALENGVETVNLADRFTTP